jgi:hypothetical protein
VYDTPGEPQHTEVLAEMTDPDAIEALGLQLAIIEANGGR